MNDHSRTTIYLRSLFCVLFLSYTQPCKHAAQAHPSQHMTQTAELSWIYMQKIMAQIHVILQKRSMFHHDVTTDITLLKSITAQASAYFKTLSDREKKTESGLFFALELHNAQEIINFEEGKSVLCMLPVYQDALIPVRRFTTDGREEIVWQWHMVFLGYTSTMILKQSPAAQSVIHNPGGE